MIPREVFLSHASADRDFADQLAGVLRRHNIPLWYSPAHIVGAQQWQDEIGTALKRCDWFVVILSPKAVQSPWVKRELSYALQQQRYVNRITPVLHNRAITNNSPGHSRLCNSSVSPRDSSRAVEHC